MQQKRLMAQNTDLARSKSRIQGTFGQTRKRCFTLGSQSSGPVNEEQVGCQSPLKPFALAVHQLHIQIRQIQTWLYHLLAWRLKTGDLTEVQFLYLQNGDYRPLLTGLLWLSHRMVFAIASSTELSRQMNGKTTKTLSFHKKWKSLSFHIYK